MNRTVLADKPWGIIKDYLRVYTRSERQWRLLPQQKATRVGMFIWLR